ncbi:MAG TPA: hypothetical protein VLX91_09335 [Candidatus Acidoferrales bacterium]|nr:hypothetical protein [Candidatus Acidoferrales bacterium]
MRCLKLGLFIFVLFVAAVESHAQYSVNLDVNVPQYNQIYIADLDIQNKIAQSSGVLFTATLRSKASTPIQVKLNLSVNVTLVGQTPFQVAQGTTTPLTLNPGQLKVITNVDLSGPTPPIQFDSYSFDQSQFDRIRDVALATGKAPAGVYEFKLTCFDVSGNQVSNDAAGDIIVTNPSRIDLVIPIEGENVTTLFPHFQWSANSDTVILSIYEKLPSQQSPQDVVSGVPFLQQTVAGSSFNYPPSGAAVRPLENGKTYYWFVDIPPSSTRGNGTRSDIWDFTVGGIDTTGGAGVDNVAATKALQNLLNGTQYQSLLNQITTLNGNSSYDGSSLNIQDLIDILQNMDKSKITNVTIQ